MDDLPRDFGLAQRRLDETLAAFPYVNGDLFAEKLGFADFNREMRNCLLACTRFDWSCISPAIFGSLFQGIIEARERRQIGGHYTSERDILKVIRALFLDESITAATLAGFVLVLAGCSLATRPPPELITGAERAEPFEPPASREVPSPL